MIDYDDDSIPLVVGIYTAITRSCLLALPQSIFDTNSVRLHCKISLYTTFYLSSACHV